MAGRGPIIVDSKRYMESDVRRFLWLTPVLIVLILFYVFRTFRGIVLPLCVSGLAVLWTFGLFAATGGQVSLPITMLPTLVSVICLSDTIHILAHYYEHAAESPSRRDALVRTMSFMVRTCFLTTLTTAVGIGSLGLTGMRSLEVFALWSAIGIVISFILSIIVMPATLAMLPRPTDKTHVRLRESLSSRAMRGAVAITRTRPVVLALVVLGCVAIGAGLFRIELDTRFSSNIPQTAPSWQASQLLKEKLSGTSVLHVVLEGGEYAFEEPTALRSVDELQRFLTAQAEINYATSVADLIAETHQQFAGGDTSGLPDDGRVITDYFVYLSQTELLDRMANADRSRVVLFAAMNEMGTSAQIELLKRIDAWGAEHLPSGLTLHTTGTAKLFATTSHRLVTGQVRSLSFTFLALTLILMIALRSPRLGLISMIPNTIPVLLTLGAMGYLGIPLGTSTIMISCVAIGIAVDDTIHFLSRYLHEARISDDPYRVDHPEHRPRHPVHDHGVRRRLRRLRVLQLRADPALRSAHRVRHDRGADRRYADPPGAATPRRSAVDGVSLALVKLGGSIATDADATEHGLVAVGRLVRLARELSSWDGGLIVVHGTGAIGKPAAIREGFEDSGRLPSSRTDVALRIKEDLAALTGRVVRALASGGIDAVPVDVTGTLDSESRRDVTDLDVLRRSLDSGQRPVLRGDMVRETRGGHRVLSSDEIMSRLAAALKPAVAAFVTDVDGVLDDRGRVIDTLHGDRLADVLAGESDERDVSGGMSGKIEHALRTARHAGRCVIVNGAIEGRVADLLSGATPVHTRVIAVAEG